MADCYDDDDDAVYDDDEASLMENYPSCDDSDAVVVV